MAASTSRFQMRDDMSTEHPTALEPDTIHQLQQLAHYRINYNRIKRWAYREIRFLVFDDTNIKIDGYDSDDEEGMEDFAKHLSSYSTGSDELPNSQRMTKSTLIDTDDVAESSSAVNPRSSDERCKICSQITPFPVHYKPRKFRLVNPQDKELQPCRDYLAVSYCWPKNDQGDLVRLEGSYQVRDLDGTVRTNRAPDDIIDRAVDMAISCGLRMIWIDQECLPQDNSEYHQLGVQAMDIVYNRAFATAGFLGCQIVSQSQVDAIRLLGSFELSPSGMFTVAPRGWSRADITPAVMDYVLDFIHQINSDTWYTRAWIIQEAMSAGYGLLLALPRGLGIRFRSTFNAASDTHPASPYDLTRRLPSINIALHINEFQHLIRIAEFILIRDFERIGEVLVRVTDGQGIQKSSSGAKIINRAKQQNPMIPIPKSLQKSFYAIGGSNYGTRQTCDAASALGLLITRRCFYPHDRIAILGNLCNYDVRLDTSVVAENCSSLRLGYLALALLNGDCSLLTPEVYNLDPGYSLAQGHKPRWLAPLDEHPNRIAFCKPRNGKHCTPTCYNYSSWTLRNEGLCLRSYLWKVDRKVDLTPVMSQWADAWHRLKCLRIELSEENKETYEQHQQRLTLALQRYSQGEEMRRVLEEIRNRSRGIGSPSTNDSLEPAQGSAPWRGQGRDRESIERDGLIFTAHIDAMRVSHHKVMRSLVTDIIFAILRYLYCEGELGLANSIWQSIRVDCTYVEQGVVVDDVPDEVGDWLFAPADLVPATGDPWMLLQLDVSAVDATFRQLWFVERIMRDGILWAGRYTGPGMETQEEEQEQRGENKDHDDRCTA